MLGLKVLRRTRFINRTYQAALKWYTRAAEQGNFDAYFNPRVEIGIEIPLFGSMGVPLECSLIRPVDEPGPS